MKTHLLAPGGKDNLVSFQAGAVGKRKAMRCDLSDLLIMLDLDLAIRNHLRGSEIDVVAAAALQILDEKTAVAWTVVTNEAGCLQPLHRIGGIN